MLQYIASHQRSAESAMERAVADNMSPEMMAKLFGLAKLQEENQHAEVIEQHRHRPWATVAGVAGFLVFTLLFSWMALHCQKSEIILPLVTGLVGLFTGAAGGYGYAQANPAGRRTGSPRR